eukprot:TRINITY_DN9261_c0_g2_i2.p2 TRINITY_DN9261_c0_g2~~TRINITY_DN9261_c0_g2_i2.p2  ORF type:complete len:126 (+),score=22.55 TRINITY_DN9261_c0_g2_i2:42-419(+)
MKVCESIIRSNRIDWQIYKMKNGVRPKAILTSRYFLSPKGPFTNRTANYILPKSDPDDVEAHSAVPKIKRDRYGTEISKARKLHRVTFRDVITGKNLADVKEVESYKAYNVLNEGKKEDGICYIV